MVVHERAPLTTPLAGSADDRDGDAAVAAQQHGDFMVQLGRRTSGSTRCCTATVVVGCRPSCRRPWDLGGQWNKLALLSARPTPTARRRAASSGYRWTTTRSSATSSRSRSPSTTPHGVDLVLWGDEEMTYTQGHSEGVNTGLMLVRKSEWARRLLASRRPRVVGAEGDVHQPRPGRARPRASRRRAGAAAALRNFTMNASCAASVRRQVCARRALDAVWSDALPFVLQPVLQMCRGHSSTGVDGAAPRGCPQRVPRVHLRRRPPSCATAARGATALPLRLRRRRCEACDPFWLRLRGVHARCPRGGDAAALRARAETTSTTSKTFATQATHAVARPRSCGPLRSSTAEHSHSAILLRIRRGRHTRSG